LRLSQTDVRNFAENGIVRETIVFDPASQKQLSYAIERNETADAVTVTFDNNCVTVTVPKAQADRWTSTEEVGIETKQEANQLTIVIEKDFACLNPRHGEEDKDTFPHPNVGQTC
jgi:hypothetical protein